MKTLKFENVERDLWLYSRLGKLTGTRLKDTYSKRDPDKKKIGFYEMIAEKLGLPGSDTERAMERGSRLEAEALERFAKETGKQVDMSMVIWTRDENESIAISPDGIVSEEEAVEVKCLSSARHIEAYLTKKIPDEYEMQCLQYFVVNDKLQKLNFVCYDPRFAYFREPETQKQNSLDYFVIELTRAELGPKIEEMLIFETRTIKEINEIVNKLTF